MQFSNRNFFLASFVKHISCPLIFKRDGLGGLFDTLKELEESQYWSQERLRELQFERFKKLLIVLVIIIMKTKNKVISLYN